jgi:hypothetical protein
MKFSVLAAVALLTACATPPEPPGPPAKEEVVAVTASLHLVRFNAGQPQIVRDRRPLRGLRPGETVLGIDYRVARGELYALGALGTSAQLYRIDVGSAAASPVGSGFTLPSTAPEWGFDFNPTVDRIRVVNSQGLNLRLHPDTGTVVDADAQTPGLQLDSALTDAQGRPAGLVAAGYSYNARNDKITTNYALDGAAGTLVHQGSLEGVTPAVSPNTGRLFTVGTLGTGPFTHATLDLSDVSNAAYASVRNVGEAVSRWYRIDLTTGQARLIGRVQAGEPLVGAAIEP